MSLEEDEAYVSELSMVRNNIVYYNCLTIMNIGFASNILNILICLRKSIQKNTMGLYNILMSTFNILSFMFAYLLFFPESIGKEDLVTSSYYSCILISFFSRVFIQMSSWVNVMVSVDRTIFISYPNKFNFLKNKKIIIWIVFGIFLLMCGVNVPNFFFVLATQKTYMTNFTGNHTICGATDEIALAKYTFIILMRIIFPIFLTALSSVIMIYKIFKSRKNLKITRSLYKDYQFAFTIVLLNLAYIITESPFIWGTIYMYISDSEDIKNSANLRKFELAKLLFVSTFMFSTYMLGSLFFVNLFFNKIFQKEIKHIFSSHKIKPTIEKKTKSTIK